MILKPENEQLAEHCGKLRQSSRFSGHIRHCKKTSESIPVCTYLLFHIENWFFKVVPFLAFHFKFSLQL